MPYTPPAARSPADSTAISPDTSRRPSVQSGNRPSLPRSASYLTRQPRRTNSWSERNAEKTATANTLLNGAAKSPAPVLSRSLSQTTPPGTSEDLQSLVTNSIVRQSPPPVTDTCSMPKGAIISPPESSSSSSDEGEEVTRGRQLDRHIKELQEAISQIPQRPMSPPRRNSDNPGANPSGSAVLSSEGMHHSFSTGSLTGLGSGARRISHVKSNTEPNIILSESLGASLTGSEEDSEDDLQSKPAMVRKKSGELVRPALRAPSRKRPSSMPGTPTFSKNVHFDACLEQVRHFCDVDRPSAVSAGSSPVDTYDTDDEFPFEPRKRAPPFEWELRLNNFPASTEARKSLPVWMERVWLSSDQKSLMGSVVVANLAFQKSVVCRFTLDHWKTTSEVAADYTQKVHPRESHVSRDRFTFSIELSDTAHLEAKTLYFCIRYNVNGCEYWDNNSDANFQVDFRKKMLPQNGKWGFQGASSRPVNSLPRSGRRPTLSASRKAPATSELDTFGSRGKPNRKSIQEMLGDSAPAGIRLKGVKSASSLASDNLPSGLSSPSGQAFSNRYDFGASLSAAKQAAKSSPRTNVDSDGLYMKPNRRGEAAAKARVAAGSPADKAKPASNMPSNGPGFSPAQSAIASSSYEEILNKYCFFGTKQGSPQMENGAAAPSQPNNKPDSGSGFDKKEPKGSSDGSTNSQGVSSSSSSSSSNPSPSPDRGLQREPTAMHHSLYPFSSHEFFYGAPLALASSPLHSPSPQPGSRSNSPATLGSGFTPLAATTIRG